MTDLQTERAADWCLEEGTRIIFTVPSEAKEGYTRFDLAAETAKSLFNAYERGRRDQSKLVQGPIERVVRFAFAYLKLVKHAGNPSRVSPVMAAERQLMAALEHIETVEVNYEPYRAPSNNPR